MPVTPVTGTAPDPNSQGTEGNGATVKTREPGRTGIRVSPYCLSTMMFGQAGNPDHDDCVRIIHRALDSGTNFIDTADVSYTPPSVQLPSLRRRSADERAAVAR
ncbi:hypothetical protein GCM10009574_018950 [Streptomyces asiaticus]|uniref:NADP-dependent oxidoreductase domain-containing protein n=2 Tax=Streptomyces rhizosphaericus TaxID=114699 RepID=A0ABN1RXZ4_9ACTN